VATAVGGVAAGVGDAALLVEPGDAGPPAHELLRMAGDEDLRRRLIEAGIERVRANTLEAESRRVAEFFAGG
jgi:glycosyltransferase involved in cell wall biosynthesis